MKFPGADYLRRIRERLLPTNEQLEKELQERLAALRAGAEARQNAKAAEAQTRRVAHADRLKPYIGRLFIVSNFRGGGLEEKAIRIRDAVLAPANLGLETPIGITAILSSRRSDDNHKQLLETANVLEASFANSIGECAFPVEPRYAARGAWLVSLAEAAEDTARQANVLPHQVGYVVAVSALDMNQRADVYGIPASGTALKLADIGGEARLVWETIAAPPDDQSMFAAYRP